jgi:UDP-4-amino-4-deoxy-L-arabinose formyltransferase/UDP-glucuronic acid dehydrogenase (UDP-4-keto-hexauronic acid decarboxylating)
MKVVVMGYHDIGYICLRELLAAGADVRAVVTHADNPGETIWFRSVRDLAFERCLPVFQPPDVNAPAMVEAMRRIAPDVIFSFYFRQMLGRAILDIPRAGAFNLHGSLLPRYRGRCPVNWVLVRGESETGVTLHRMEIKADSGPILAQARVPIDFTDSARTLFDKMTDAAAALMRETWPRMLRGEITETPQDHAAASYFGGRSQKDGLIDWGRPATAIYNLVRAVTHPYPGAFTLVPGGRRLFVWWAEPDEDAPTGGAAPGTVLSPRRPGAIDVATGKGVLRIVRAQAEGGEEAAAAGAIDIPTGAVLG